MGIDKLVSEFKEVTDGLVSEGFASLDVGSGKYELHMKKFHVGVFGGLNVFNAKELSMRFYKWATTDEVAQMMELREFPVNLRTLYRGQDGLYILEDTYMFRDAILTEEDLRAIIADDFKEIGREFGCIQQKNLEPITRTD